VSAFLDTMTERSRQRLEDAARVRPVAEVQLSALSTPPPRALGGFGRSFDLIAEIKPRSPSEGRFPERDPVATAIGYQTGLAAVLSVLTEPSSFGGSLDDLRSISASVDIPVMAKDFLVDPYQVYEAREAGADGVLLIARILSDEALVRMIAVAAQLGMFTLLEAFDADDLERMSSLARPGAATLIGVNCRDLDTLEIVPERHRDLAGHLPAGQVAVAESAMSGPGDVERVAGLGYHAALVGSALMRSEAPQELARSMVESGRRAMAVAG